MLCNYSINTKSDQLIARGSAIKSRVLLAVLFCFTQYSIAMEQQMPPAQVSVVLAEERLMAPTMSVSGSVVSLSDAFISTQVLGELQWIASVGTEVKQGDIIAKMIPTLLEIDLQTAKAQLEKQRADLEFRESEVKRFKVLANKNNTSKTRLQEESAKRDMLLQDIRISFGNVALAKHNLAQTNIKAPFGGHVMSQLASIGEYLAVGENVIRLVDTFNREVALNAPMSLLPYLKKNLPIEVSAANLSESFPIKAIVPVGDETSRMVEIRLEILNNRWIVGTPVIVNLPKALALSRITIPRDALVIKGTDVFIYRIGQDMLAEKIAAQIEALDGDWVAIKASLKVGDKIVIRGGERLMPGQTVSFMEKIQ